MGGMCPHRIDPVLTASDHYGMNDRDILEGAVTLTGLGFSDFVYHIHTFDDMTEDRVLIVKEVVVYQIDEELAAAGVVTCVCHRQCSAVVPVMKGEFILDRITRAPAAGSGRVAALEHETVDDPMEDYSIIVAFFYKCLEITGRYGHFWIEGDRDVTHIGLKPDLFLNFWCSVHKVPYLICLPGSFVL